MGRGWEEWLALLDAYAVREQNAAVPTHHVEGEAKLGLWVARQRAKFRDRTLEKDKIDELARRPGWSWEPRAELRRDGMEVLDAYIERNGHARIPIRHFESGFALGAWAHDKRQRYRDDRLSRDTVDELESRPEWVWNLQGARFAFGLSCLDAFVKRERHAQVPVLHVEGDYRLGNWVHDRRTSYSRGLIKPETVIALEAVAGWTWVAQRGDPATVFHAKATAR